MIINFTNFFILIVFFRYKENKVAMRWTTKNELKIGKGQFVCGGRKCDERELIRTWEVNFAYVEEGDKKNALVKVRLCPDCSYKLNYHHKKKEVTKHKSSSSSKKKHKKHKKKRKHEKSRSESEHRTSDSTSDTNDDDEETKNAKKRKKDQELETKASEIWSAPMQLEQEKSSLENMDEFLEDLFL